MTPTFHILANDTDITAAIAARLVSLKISDQAGWKSDTAELQLDDRDGHIALPAKGARLQVALGYETQGPVAMGTYTVDELELSGPPDTLIIRARAADMRKSLKSQRNATWHNTTIGTLVKTIATAHGLVPKTGPALANIPIPHLDQTEESDLNLLTRLGHQYDAIAKPANGHLLFVRRGEGTSATGKTILKIAIHRNDSISHRVTLADRGRYQSVKTTWHNTRTGQRITVTAGQGKPTAALRHTYPDEAQAKAAAKARLATLNRGLARLSLTLTGKPELTAEARLTLAGFRPGINGPWIATRIDHELNTSGYTTRVEAETPKP